MVEIIVIFYFPKTTKISLFSLPTSNIPNPPLTFQHHLSGVTSHGEVCPADVGRALAQLIVSLLWGGIPSSADSLSVGWILQSEGAVKAEMRSWHSWPDAPSFQHYFI